MMRNLFRYRMYFGFTNIFLTSIFIDFVVESIHKFKMFIEVRYVITDFIDSTYDIIKLWILQYPWKLKPTNIDETPACILMSTWTSFVFFSVEMVLKFRSIDLEALQNLHLTTRGDISDDLQQQVNSLLLGEVAQSFNLTWIKQVHSISPG